MFCCHFIACVLFPREGKRREQQEINQISEWNGNIYRSEKCVAVKCNTFLNELAPVLSNYSYWILIAPREHLFKIELVVFKLML